MGSIKFSLADPMRPLSCWNLEFIPGSSEYEHTECRPPSLVAAKSNIAKKQLARTEQQKFIFFYF